MLAFDEASRRSTRAMWLILSAGFLVLLGVWLVNLNGAASIFQDGSSPCEFGELTVPNGRDLVANIRRTACAPAFAPDDIDYFVFVHRVGEPDEKSNLVFHYQPDDDGPFPVITPRVFWSDFSSLHIALSSSAVAPSWAAPTRLTRLGRVQIIYDTAAHNPKEIIVPATRLHGEHRLNLPIWSTLHSGMKVFFGDDPVNGRDLTVCPSLDSYNFVRVNNDGPGNMDATIGSSRCTHARYGAPATVTAIIPSTIDEWYYPAPLVRVSVGAGRSGITTALGLQPDVPIGSILTMTKKEFPVRLDLCPDGICPDGADTINRVEIPGSVRVRVLRYDPGPHASDNLYVQVLNGSYTGRRGWMPLDYMQSADSLYSNLYGLDYTFAVELRPDAR